MTMRTKYIAIFIAALVSLTAQAQEFSADTVTPDSPGRIFRGKLYRSATMIRAGADATPSKDGDPTFIISTFPSRSAAQSCRIARGSWWHMGWRR